MCVCVCVRVCMCACVHLTSSVSVNVACVVQIRCTYVCMYVLSTWRIYGYRVDICSCINVDTLTASDSN